MALLLRDSDAIIDNLNGISDTIKFLHEMTTAGHQFAVCDVVVAEVHTVLQTAAQRQLSDILLASYRYVPTSFRSAQLAGDWRREFRSKGIELSTGDCLIAAVAVDHDAILITVNVRRFPMAELRIQPLPRVLRGGTGTGTSRIGKTPRRA